MKNSVIIPAFNVENYIEKCICSVLEQPCSDELEIIVVDDGSRDKTGLILDNISAEDNRVKVIHQKNSGQASARNKALKVATGEYVFFLDSDDFWTEKSYGKIVSLLKENKPDMLIFGAKSYYRDQHEDIFFTPPSISTPISSVKMLKTILEQDYSFGWCPIWYAIRREIIIRYDLSFPEGYLSEDSLFSFQLYYYTKTVCSVPEYVYNYRRDNESSTTHLASFKFCHDLMYVVQQNYDFLEKYYKDQVLQGLLKLNLQTLIEVVLFWYTSYKSEQRVILREQFKNVKSILNYTSVMNQYAHRKERIIKNAINVLGFDTVGKIWGIRRKILRRK